MWALEFLRMTLVGRPGNVPRVDQWIDRQTKKSQALGVCQVNLTHMNREPAVGWDLSLGDIQDLKPG